MALLISVTLFSENMPPWKAPYVSDGKGASSGEVVEGSSGKAGEGKSGNVIENVSKQSQAKGRELQKPKKTLPKKIPKAKPTINGPVFSQSPISMKKIKLRGKKVNPSNFMSECEEDEGVERGREIGERETILSETILSETIISVSFISVLIIRWDDHKV